MYLLINYIFPNLYNVFFVDKMSDVSTSWLFSEMITKQKVAITYFSSFISYFAISNEMDKTPNSVNVLNAHINKMLI